MAIIKCSCSLIDNCMEARTSDCIQCRRNQDRALNNEYDEYLPYNDPDKFREKFRKGKNDFEI